MRFGNVIVERADQPRMGKLINTRRRYANTYVYVSDSQQPPPLSEYTPTALLGFPAWRSRILNPES